MADTPSTPSPLPPMFVAAGHHGQRLLSLDGETWTDLQTGKEGEVYRSVAYGNDRFVAVGAFGGENIFAATTDGKTWHTQKKPNAYSNIIRGSAFGAGQFLALGGDPGSVGSSRPFVMLSTDGVAWSEQISIAGKEILRRVAWGNDRFVGVGDRGRRATSPDAKTWTDAPQVKAVDTLVDIAFGAGRFVGVGLHGLRMSSEDGLSWSERLTGEEGEHLNTILWTGEKFAAIGAGATFFSADGRQWERQPNRNAPLAAAYGAKKFVGVNWRGRILRSVDGVEWQDVFKAPQHLEAIAFGPGAATT